MDPANPPPTSPIQEQEEEIPSENQVSPTETPQVEPEPTKSDQEISPDPSEEPKKPPKPTPSAPGPKIIKGENDLGPQMATRKEISTAQRLKKGKIFNLTAAILLSLSLAGLIWVVNFLLRKFG